jgi:hypothetical protein
LGEDDREKIESKKSRDTVQFQENPKLSNFELKLVLTNHAICILTVNFKDEKKIKSLFCLASYRKDGDGSLPLHLQKKGVILAASKGRSHILDLILAGSFLIVCSGEFFYVCHSFLLISNKFCDLGLLHWPLFRDEMWGGGGWGG